MAENSDFSMLAAQGAPGERTLPTSDTEPRFGAALQKALGDMREFQASQQMKDQIAADPVKGLEELKMTADGNWSAKFHKSALEALIRDHEQLNQIRGAFHQQAEQLRMQEQAIRNQPPWVQLATALAGNLAQAKDMPGWVQGLGRTAAQLNPRPEEIQARRLGVLGEEAKIAEKGAALHEASLRTMLEQKREDRLLAQAQQSQVGKTFGELSDQAQKGELTNAGLVEEVLRRSGMSAEEAAAKAKVLVSASAEKRQLIQEAQTATDQRHREDIAQRDRAVATTITRALLTTGAKQQEKAEGDAALNDVAKALAAGDLSAIRDVTSFRGQDRMKLYAAVKKIDPNFSTSELQRKIDTLKSFETGKEADALKSFDTFLQHAGEVTETIKRVSQTQSPLMNKTLNWWKRNMSGSPEYQRLLVSLEPVGKEYESFLLNQRALYESDRKTVSKLLDGDMTMAQMLAAVQQMGVTARDRFSAMQQKFRRVMKQDIPEPFGPEALLGAQKIGIDLPGSTEGADETASGVTKSGTKWQLVK